MRSQHIHKMKNVSTGRDEWRGFNWSVHLAITHRMVVDQVMVTAIYDADMIGPLSCTLVRDCGPFDNLGELITKMVVDSAIEVIDSRLAGEQMELPFDPFTR